MTFLHLIYRYSIPHTYDVLISRSGDWLVRLCDLANSFPEYFRTRSAYKNQSTVFLLVEAMSLWVTQLVNTAITKISVHTVTAIYSTTVIAILALLVPWIAMVGMPFAMK